MDVGLVCDACSALTPIGVPQCARCGEPVALDPRPRRTSKPPTTTASAPASAPAASATNNGVPVPAGAVECQKCHAAVPPNFKFCQSCGARVIVPQNFDVETRV